MNRRVQIRMPVVGEGEGREALITHGRVHEVNILDETPIEAGAVYVTDGDYLDFHRLYRVINQQSFL